LRGIQGKCQCSVWIEHSSLPDCARPSLVPDRKYVLCLGELEFWVCLVVFVWVPHY